MLRRFHFFFLQKTVSFCIYIFYCTCRLAVVVNLESRLWSKYQYKYCTRRASSHAFSKITNRYMFRVAALTSAILYLPQSQKGTACQRRTNFDGRHCELQLEARAVARAARLHCQHVQPDRTAKRVSWRPEEGERCLSTSCHQSCARCIGRCVCTRQDPTIVNGQMQTAAPFSSGIERFTGGTKHGVDRWRVFVQGGCFRFFSTRRAQL